MTIAHHTPGRAGVRQTRVLLGTLGRYWVCIFPEVRRELDGWRRRAHAIPDPVLRRQACATLADEHLNAEGAAIFAVLAPSAQRALAVRLLVAYQVMYDYLDTLTEQPVAAPLANSRRLHRALASALGAPAPVHGWYVCHSHRADGGYLDALVHACRETLDMLPSSAVVLPSALRTVRRSAEGQSRNHAALHAPSRAGLEHWATAATPRGSGLRWWETAAAAGSSLATHALLASAADPTLTHALAERVEEAYWPWINGLNTLLESLADRSEDVASGNHSYVAHYATPQTMAQRLGAIAKRASDAARELPGEGRHLAILSGMVAFYLAAPDAKLPTALPAARRVRVELSVELAPLLAVLRLRHRLARRGRSDGPAHAVLSGRDPPMPAAAVLAHPGRRRRPA